MASGTRRRGWSDLIGEGPADLRETLIDSTHADLRAALEALCARDFERAEFIAHRMKGTARLLDVHATIAACIALETQCRQRDAARSRAALSQLGRSFDAAFHALDAPAQSIDPTRSFESDT
jgi:HPt (histidine-containing phosphotransfer) domain-containing protein